MPFYYDAVRLTQTSTLALTEKTHMWGRTNTNQMPVQLCALYAAAQLATAGGGAVRVKTNSGAIALGGSALVPPPRHPLARAADSVWASDSTAAITPGATLATRLSVGFAQAGGPAPWIGFDPESRLSMMPGGANPVDLEIVSLTAASGGVPVDITAELSEGGA